MKNKTELIQKASVLYQLGIEVEKAREKLKKLVDAGVSYESCEMLAALQSFQQMEEKWKDTEKEFLLLRERIEEQGK